MIGHIPGIAVGTIFKSRRELHDAGVHKSLVAGIGAKGESIVLAGGYVDDVGDGDSLIYTGEGGRSINTGRQVADQALVRGNAALVHHFEKGSPIRVTRGHQLRSSNAPREGYRYDGLYRIENYWCDKGRDGFLVWRFRMIRLEGQNSIPKPGPHAGDPLPKGTTLPGLQTVTTSRVIRNSAVGEAVKALYEYRCQICGERLKTALGYYAECCHIRPLGRPHNGPDTPDNVLCLCPNHHVLFDLHAIHLSDDLQVLETNTDLTLAPGHMPAKDNVRYHREHMPGPTHKN